MDLEVLGTEVALSSQEHLNVLLGGREGRGKVVGSHPERLEWWRGTALVVVELNGGRWRSKKAL